MSCIKFCDPACKRKKAVLIQPKWRESTLKSKAAKAAATSNFK